MTGFEAFDLRAWTDRILTRWDKDFLATPRSSKLASLRRAVVAAVVVATPAITSPAIAASMHAEIDSSITACSFAAPDLSEGDHVPLGYWPALMKRMQSWEPVGDAGTLSLPEPLI